MNIDRLKHLITILAAVPVEQFDINDWKEEKSCGTTACALGWAGSDPQFIAEGFTLLTGAFYRPQFEEFSGYDAGAEFFGIAYVQAQYLFSPNEYHTCGKNVTPADVIRRIESLLEDA